MNGFNKVMLLCMMFGFWIPCICAEAGANNELTTAILADSVVTNCGKTSVVEAVEIEEFEIKEKPVVFVPKGQWVAGISVSYDQTTQNDYQFLILEHLSGDTYSFKISPMVCFMVKNDLGLGGRFQYQRALTKLENADIVLDSETDYNIDHLYRLSHNYYGTLIMRNYFALGNSGRLGIFNETQLKFGGGQAKLMTGLGNDLSGNYETNFNFSVGFAPGIAFFLNDYSAIEVNVGVLGFQYVKTKTLTDQIYEASRKSQYANFRVNLFSIQFGMAFYI